MRIRALLVASFITMVAPARAMPPSPERPRLLVLTDISSLTAGVARGRQRSPRCLAVLDRPVLGTRWAMLSRGVGREGSASGPYRGLLPKNWST